jgi:hypothetical protein
MAINGEETEAHSMYKKYHFHHTDSGKVHDERGETVEDEASFPQFHKVPKTGVIYATSRAVEHGYTADDESWANMGQGEHVL